MAGQRRFNHNVSLAHTGALLPMSQMVLNVNGLGSWRCFRRFMFSFQLLFVLISIYITISLYKLMNQRVNSKLMHYISSYISFKYFFFYISDAWSLNGLLRFTFDSVSFLFIHLFLGGRRLRGFENKFVCNMMLCIKKTQKVMVNFRKRQQIRSQVLILNVNVSKTKRIDTTCCSFIQSDWQIKWNTNLPVSHRRDVFETFFFLPLMEMFSVASAKQKSRLLFTFFGTHTLCDASSATFLDKLFTSSCAT